VKKARPKVDPKCKPIMPTKEVIHRLECLLKYIESGSDDRDFLAVLKSQVGLIVQVAKHDRVEQGLDKPDAREARRKEAAEIAREMKLEFDRSSDDRKQLLLKANGDLIQDNVIWAFARLNNAILLLASEED
jgi:hypothetical protein